MSDKRDDAASQRDRAGDARDLGAKARRVGAAARDDLASARDRRSRHAADEADAGFADRFLSGRDVDDSTGDRAAALSDERYAREDRSSARADRKHSRLARLEAAQTQVVTAREIASLRRALAGPTLIGQAQGLLMERLGIGADAAFRLLLREAQASNSELHTIARTLVREAEQTATVNDQRET